MRKLLAFLLACSMASAQTTVLKNTTVMPNTTPLMNNNPAVTIIAKAGSATAINTIGATALVVGCWNNSSTPTDTLGNTWNLAGTITTGLSVYFVYAPTTGTSDTFACPGGSLLGEFALGNTLTTSAVFDSPVTGWGTTNGTNPCTSSPSKTPAVGEIAISFGLDQAVDGDFTTLQSPFTIVSGSNSGGWGAGYYFPTSTSGLAVTWDFGGDASFCGNIMAMFKP